MLSPTELALILELVSLYQRTPAGRATVPSGKPIAPIGEDDLNRYTRLMFRLGLTECGLAAFCRLALWGREAVESRDALFRSTSAASAVLSDFGFEGETITQRIVAMHEALVAARQGAARASAERPDQAGRAAAILARVLGLGQDGQEPGPDRLVELAELVASKYLPAAGFTFSKAYARRLLVVVHCGPDVLHNSRQVWAAYKGNADGVLLIDHNGATDDELLETLGANIKTFETEEPGFLIGVNRLTATSRSFGPTAHLPKGARAVWTDQSARDDMHQRDLEYLRMLREHTRQQGRLLLGGLCFKHQSQPQNLDVAAGHARQLFDVAVTSGPGTGLAADVEHVARVRAALGPDHRLALASGVRLENVTGYLPHVDWCLVGTGVESSWGVVDQEKVRALADVVHAWPA